MHEHSTPHRCEEKHIHSCSCSHGEDGHGHSCSCHDHGCGCEHGGESGARLALRIIAALSALLLGHFLDGNIIVFIAAYLTVAYPVLGQAAKNILHGEVFDEMFLMSIASLGALAIGEYAEGIAVLTLYQLGEYLQGKAVDSSRRAIRALTDIRPDGARLVTDQGTAEVPAEDISPGDIIEIRVGDRIPLDGLVLEGNSTLDTAALTGESLPREVKVGEEVLSGCVNLTAVLRVRVTKPYGEDSASRILTLVEGAQAKKAKSEQFIRRFARVYTPIVVVCAIIVALLPPLLGFGALDEFVLRALNFLVISCPCALVISVPLTFFSGLGSASSRGILIKGSNYLEALAAAEIAVFDKTGTLTKGSFSIASVHTAAAEEKKLLELAAYGESRSNHPIARSIVAAYGKTIDPARLTNVCESAGKGVSAILDGKELLVGNGAILAENELVRPHMDISSTAVHVAYDNEYCGYLLLEDELKENIEDAVPALRKLGLQKLVMLSGDSQSAVDRVAAALCFDEALGEQMPEDKLAAFEALKPLRSKTGTILYVGDGINDAPVLAAADCGIAMGAFGSGAAMETADVVLMSDNMENIAKAIEISKKTAKIVRQNVIFSLAMKGVILLFSLTGHVSLWAAVFADVGVCMLTILNALRAMK